MKKALRKRRRDFSGRKSPSERTWYDLTDDWPLIEASFTAQYGIRLRREHDMTWGEFSALLAGLMPETPLGMTVQIRSERDPEKIARFTPAQRRIYDAWAGRGLHVQTDPAAYEAAMRQMEQIFRAFGGG